MRYLFFDIECCDGKNICTFGYTITDENFNVIEKDDILVNPEARFTIPTREKRINIQLAYPKSAFLNAPNYPAVYERIAKIINHPDQKIFGHAVASDINFLATANRRYHMPEFNITAFDTQKLYAKHTKGGTKSLESIATSLGVDLNGIELHKSCDDALLTMLCAKAMSKKTGKSAVEMFANAKDCVVTSKDVDYMHRRHIEMPRKDGEEIAEIPSIF